MAIAQQVLIDAALAVRNNAYAPYSKFRVGAALEVEGQQQPIVGCNVENASYGLAICAERMAVGSAVAKGMVDKRSIKTVVVAASPLATPCGACRQFLSEFNLDMEVICVDANNPSLIKRWRLNELLPESFQF